MSERPATERVEPPFAADEQTMLLAYLDYYRDTMVMKLDGLTEVQARWTPAPTANSLLGLVNHLSYVEHWWFYECFLGKEPELPDIFADDRDADFKPPPEHTIDFVIRRYRAECARSNAIARAAGLDEVARHKRGVERGISMRWILVHMVEETARHAGHADITRELIDGTLGS